jgi:dipeptidyl aminopeptidase/acylaminoacyl peptidase
MRQYSTAIYTVALDDGTVKVVANMHGWGSDGVWLDGGYRIAFIDKQAYSSSDTAVVSVFDLRTSSRSILFVHPGEMISHLSVSPSRALIAFIVYPDQNSEVGQLAVVNADGSNERILTTSPTSKYSLAWSPQSDQLAFVSGVKQESHIWKLQLNNGQSLQLTSGTGSDTDPCFSPDGSRIVYCAEDSGKSGVFLMNSDGSNRIAITPFDSNAYRSGSTWSWQIDYIAYLQQDFAFSGNPAEQHVYVIRPDGSSLRSISSGSGPDWQPRWTPDGNNVLYISTAASPSNLFIADGIRGNAGQLTFFSDPDSGGITYFDVVQSTL